MKKIAMPLFLFAFLFVASGAIAGENKNKLDFSKLIKVNDFKIEKKQVISEKERSLRESELKGKAGGGISGGKVSPIVTGAAGVLGTRLDIGAKKYAIVIGLSNYAGTINDLCVTPTDSISTLCADGDSLNMTQALKNAGYAEENIFVFRDDAASFSAVDSKVQEIIALANVDKSLGINDEVVFFFSGHSATANDSAFNTGDSTHVGLALYNSQPDGSEVVWDVNLKSWFDAMQTNRSIFIFDTCHAGGLGSYLQANGREVMMSSSESQSSYTYSLGGPNGPGEGMFTRYLVKYGILDGQADGYNALGKRSSTKYDGKVAVEEAYEFSKKYVPYMTTNRQIPMLNDNFANDLLLGY